MNFVETVKFDYIRLFQPRVMERRIAAANYSHCSLCWGWLNNDHPVSDVKLVTGEIGPEIHRSLFLRVTPYKEVLGYALVAVPECPIHKESLKESLLPIHYLGHFPASASRICLDGQIVVILDRAMKRDLIVEAVDYAPAKVLSFPLQASDWSQ